MTTNDGIEPLIEKLEVILKRQEHFSREIKELSDEINRLKSVKVIEQVNTQKTIETANTEPEIESGKTVIPDYQPAPLARTVPEKSRFTGSESNTLKKTESDVEKFIGENLINKIGIVITVIGVAIGAKYAIDHDLISPLTRIILGYMMGLILLGIGIKLKKNYENYSAVLVSGAISIFYLITYLANSLYDLIPQPIAFSMMVIFTVFAVIAAIDYNLQVIAHIGMVGAYAVPFLLSKEPGEVKILFGYIAIINIGILLIALRKYWKPLYYSSFVFTWLIVISWFVSKFQTTQHFGLSLIFISIFFATFYIIFLAYKIRNREKFDIKDVMLLLANSFIFYGLGYSILKSNATGTQLLGLYTLCNSIIHLGVGLTIHLRKMADRNLFYFVMGLGIVFCTIAIPVQFDANWVTLMWAGESALLFWIGRTRHVYFYEILSYAMMMLAFISIIQDWQTVYNLYDPARPETRIIPLFNINFLTSFVVISSFGFINYLNSSTKYSMVISFEEFQNLVSFWAPTLLLVVLYFSFKIEISTYWTQLYTDSVVKVEHPGGGYFDSLQNHDLLRFKTIWVINYSLFFMSLLSFVNIKKLKNRNMGFVALVFSALIVFVFLVLGLYSLGQLKESYLNHTLSEYFPKSIYNVGIRYISVLLTGLVLFSIYKQCIQDSMKSVTGNLLIAFDGLLYFTLLWILSSELITWMDIMKSSQSYKLGLSILWGVYTLLIISLGIWKKKKYLRVGAISLFAVTLIKLFFYDLSDLDTIDKTIVFVSLGVLLLIISFLYNKYKTIIAGGMPDAFEK